MLISTTMTAAKPMCSSALLGAVLVMTLAACSYSSLPRNIRSSGSISALSSLPAGTGPEAYSSASESGGSGASASGGGSGASGGGSGASGGGSGASGGGSGAYGFASGGGSGAYGVVSMVSCTNTSCSVTLGGNGATALVFGTRISLDSIQDGRATILVGDRFVTWGRGETVSAGRLILTCTSVQPDRVSFRASPA